MGSYYLAVLARAWRDTGAFLRLQGVPLSLAVGVLTIVITWYESIGVGERFNPRIPVYAAIMATVVVALGTFTWKLVTVPYRMHEEQAARIREFERRPDVSRLAQLREEGYDIHDRPTPQTDEQLADWRAMLRAWEDATVAELQKQQAPQADVTQFRVPGPARRVFHGVITEYLGEKEVLAERLELLTAIIRRIASTG